MNDHEAEVADKPAHFLEPYVILGSVLFWTAAGFWLHRQEYSMREDWLLRLALFGWISPFVALLIPQLCTVFLAIGGVAFCIIGLRYADDMGQDGHGITAMFLFFSGIVCLVGSILAAKAHPVLMRGVEDFGTTRITCPNQICLLARGNIGTGTSRSVRG